jgi:hypothetical protein
MRKDFTRAIGEGRQAGYDWGAFEIDRGYDMRPRMLIGKTRPPFE